MSYRGKAISQIIIAGLILASATSPVYHRRAYHPKHHHYTGPSMSYEASKKEMRDRVIICEIGTT